MKEFTKVDKVFIKSNNSVNKMFYIALMGVIKKSLKLQEFRIYI